MTTAKRIIITGASSGIGQACARLFCGEGTTVVNLDRQDGSATAALCGANFYTVQADMGNVESIRAAFQAADAIFADQPPDVMVCCAAISRAAHFLEVPVADVDALLAVNVRGLFVCGQEAGRRMRRAGKGHIIHITSVAAVSAWSQEAVYCTTKGAQMALTQAMAIELAPYGILVNAVGPGPIDNPATGMAITRNDPEVLRHELEHTPLNRFGTPAEIAETVRFLASVTWMTGQTIYVDGGFLATALAYFGKRKEALAPGEDTL